MTYRSTINVIYSFFTVNKIYGINPCTCGLPPYTWDVLKSDDGIKTLKSTNIFYFYFLFNNV